MTVLGAHVSISGGVEKSPARGREIGCDCIQIFSKNQRQWVSPALPPTTAEKFQQEMREHRIQSAVIHDSYLINLASPDPDPWHKSYRAFSDEVARADQLNVPYLVFHPGAHMKAGEEAGIHRIADALNRCVDDHPHSQVTLCLEITAGQGSSVGYRFEHLAEIIHKVEDDQRMGVCFDTAHAFAAGYDLRTEAAYKSTFDEFDKVIGIERLKVFHLNDSKPFLGNRVDRHASIGEGNIGLDAFRLLLNDPRFENIPMTLETPEGPEKYREEIKLLKQLSAVSL